MGASITHFRKVMIRNNDTITNTFKFHTQKIINKSAADSVN